MDEIPTGYEDIALTLYETMLMVAILLEYDIGKFARKVSSSSLDSKSVCITITYSLRLFDIT